jgi:lysophospholipase L1-like esterase
MAHFIVFGDSIAYGCWDDKGGWVSRLRSYLHKKVASKNYQYDKTYTVYNLAVSGDTTKEVSGRFVKEIKPRLSEEEENIIIFAFGINDSQILNKDKRNTTPLPQYIKGIKELIKLAVPFSDKIIFVGLTPVDEKKVNPTPWEPEHSYKNSHILKYNTVLKKICKESGIIFLDLFYPMNKNPKKYLSDGLHLNNDGHHYVCRKLLETINRYNFLQ